MDNISVVTTFLGWCTFINLCLYVVSAFMMTLFSTPFKNIHSSITNIHSDTLDVLYFNFLGNYKLAIFITNLVPYIALKVMGY
ncbi:hypothetical protein G8770_17865 [Aestuariicella hydrocarbonica]|uniref:DUF6868 domain-containing protein n=1 Tax=Pseudomaricurvus hydrocarbonicus TaxID=1470433 RepID=A0A9E5MNC3_9GAMM|nr:hypothetical protein [Aestuariicella hydrocarbonica]NHO67416.1 hypothetical protein [Aestuariicella hydrocarbonica]